MDMEIASFVRNVTGIEFNPLATRLSKRIAFKLNIHNATFFNEDFKNWKNLSRRKYDLILSLEVHQCIDLSPNEYVAKISSLIMCGGFVLFEDHNSSKEGNNYENYISAFMNNGFRVINSGFSKDKDSTKRIWTLLKQNGEYVMI